MKIIVDDKKCCEMTEVQKNVICNDINREQFEKDMRRRLEWVLMHKYERCFERLKKEWEPKLAARYDSVPTNKDKFAELVFSQKDYKCRAQRDKEDEAK